MQAPKTPQPEFDTRSLDQSVDAKVTTITEIDEPVEKMHRVGQKTVSVIDDDFIYTELNFTPKVNLKREKSTLVKITKPDPNKFIGKEKTPEPASNTLTRSTIPRSTLPKSTLPKSTLSRTDPFEQLANEHFCSNDFVQYRTLDRKKKDPFKGVKDPAALYKDPLQPTNSGFSSLSADSMVCEMDYMSFNVGTLRVGDSAGARIGTLNF